MFLIDKSMHLTSNKEISANVYVEHTILLESSVYEM